MTQLVSTQGAMSRLGASQPRVAMSRATQRRLYTAALVLSDILMLQFAFMAAYYARFTLKLPLFDLSAPAPLIYYMRLALILTGLWLLMLFLFQTYEWENLLGGTREYGLVINASTVALLVVVTMGFVDPTFIVARGWLLSAWLLTSLCVAGARFLLRRAAYHLRRRGYFMAPTVIIGTNAEAVALARQFSRWQTSGLKVVGFVSDDEPAGEVVTEGLHTLGGLDMLLRLLETDQVEEVVAASSAVTPAQVLEVFQVCNMRSSTRLRLSSGLFDIITTGLSVNSLGLVPLITVSKVRLSQAETITKSCLDYAGALFGIIVLAPVMTVIAAAVKLTSPGPVLYRRLVIGSGGRTFHAYKFRTMYVGGDARLTAEQRQELARSHKLRHDPRVTTIGHFLRKYSLDELPQFLNILRGQMSLVGPRMISPEERTMYGRWEANLHVVKPGLSGLWQVSGRSDVSYEERVHMDMYYIRNYTIWLDLQLILRTIFVVVKGKGAY